MYKHNENECPFLQMFIVPMKHLYFDDFVGPHVIKLLIFHQFYHHHSNAPYWRVPEIDNISLLLLLLFPSDFYSPHWWCYENADILFVLTSLLDRPTLEFYVILVVELSTTLRSSLGAPMSSQDARKASNDPSRHSQGPPMTLQGHPRVVTLWNSM